MLLVDTNGVAYLLLEGHHADGAQKLRRRDPLRCRRLVTHPKG